MQYREDQNIVLFDNIYGKSNYLIYTRIGIKLTYCVYVFVFYDNKAIFVSYTSCDFQSQLTRSVERTHLNKDLKTDRSSVTPIQIPLMSLPYLLGALSHNQ